MPVTLKRLTPEEALGLDRFDVDEGNPHIVLDKARCAACADRPCLWACPARLYRLKDGDLQFDCAGCLECGTCRVVCTGGGIVSWSHPGATYGVTFRCS
ncbi:MAG TPA: hypothetical protein VK188_07465 [Holophaga sp.]|nr:hypothetical protein [Holophaga sp.]